MRNGLIKISNSQWVITADYTNTGAVITAKGKWRGQEAGFELYLAAESNKNHRENKRLFFQSVDNSHDYGFSNQLHNHLTNYVSVYNYNNADDSMIQWSANHRYISAWSKVTRAQISAVQSLIEAGMLLLDYNTLKDISMAKLFADSAGDIVMKINNLNTKIKESQEEIAIQKALLDAVLKDYTDEQIQLFSTIYSDGTSPVDALDITKQMA